MSRFSKRNIYFAEFLPTAIQVSSAILEDFTKPSKEKDLITATFFFLSLLILCLKCKISGPLFFIAIFQTVDSLLSIVLSINMGSILRIAISFTLGSLIITLSPLNLPNRKGVFNVGMSSTIDKNV